MEYEIADQPGGNLRQIWHKWDMPIAKRDFMPSGIQPPKDCAILIPEQEHG